MDGIWIGHKRPKFKKNVIEEIEKNPGNVRLQKTTLGSNESIPIDQLSRGTYRFVGPDPYSKRVFYGTIIIDENKMEVI